MLHLLFLIAWVPFGKHSLAGIFVRFSTLLKAQRKKVDALGSILILRDALSTEGFY